MNIMTDVKEEKVDYRDVLTNYIGLIIEIEGVSYIEEHLRHEGFTDEQWEALVEVAKEHPNGVLI